MSTIMLSNAIKANEDLEEFIEGETAVRRVGAHWFDQGSDNLLLYLFQIFLHLYSDLNIFTKIFVYAFYKYIFARCKMFQDKPTL